MNNTHWAAQPERGNRLALWLTTQIVRYLPPWLLSVVVTLISRYYYHTSPRARRNIARYQRRLQTACPDLALPPDAARQQIRSFAEAIADRFAVWQHRLTYRDLTVHDPDNLYLRIDHPAPGARGHFDVLDEAREELATLGVDSSLLVLGGRPLRVSRHQFSLWGWIRTAPVYSPARPRPTQDARPGARANEAEAGLAGPGAVRRRPRERQGSGARGSWRSSQRTGRRAGAQRKPGTRSSPRAALQRGVVQ